MEKPLILNTNLIVNLLVLRIKYNIISQQSIFKSRRRVKLAKYFGRRINIISIISDLRAKKDQGFDEQKVKNTE